LGIGSQRGGKSLKDAACNAHRRMREILPVEQTGQSQALASWPDSRRVGLKTPVKLVRFDNAST
jgi:hypothetical protein